MNDRRHKVELTLLGHTPHYIVLDPGGKPVNALAYSTRTDADRAAWVFDNLVRAPFVIPSLYDNDHF